MLTFCIHSELPEAIKVVRFERLDEAGGRDDTTNGEEHMKERERRRGDTEDDGLAPFASQA